VTFRGSESGGKVVKGGAAGALIADLYAMTVRIPRHRDNEPPVRRRARSATKRAVRTLAPAPADQRRVLLVFGCQRSGTTMLQQSLLDRSWRTTIIGEHDRRVVRADDAEHLRWDGIDAVSERLKSLPFELVIAKPLVESHHVCEVLAGFERARAIWMVRHYRAVARSNVGRFGTENGYRDLRILVSGGSANWRGLVTGDVRQVVARLLSSGLSPLDAAALFWWVRNRLYLDQDLAAENRVRVLRYEHLLEDPGGCLAALCEFVALPLPITAMRRGIRPVMRSTEPLRPDVEAMCGDLLAEVERAPALHPP